MARNILSMLDLKEDLSGILAEAAKLKGEGAKKGGKRPLSKRAVVLLFEKPSLRTKASFAVAVEQLGGSSVYMGPDEVQVGTRESPSDVAKVLSRYFDAVVYRAISHSTMRELAAASDIPVINALDDLEHPCQAVGDMLTIIEKKGDLAKLKLAYIGDGNNVCNSLLLGGAITGMSVSVATPSAYSPNAELLSQAKEIAERSGANIDLMTNPFRAVADADVVYADVWVSMGQEAEREERERTFMPYQVNERVMASAKEDAIFMHCLPAHRGLEVIPEVIDGEKSVVFDQAENRLHAQKAIILAALR